MMRWLKRIAIGAVLLMLALVLVVLGIAQLRWDRTFTAPPSTITASRDSAVIARGRYLAYGPAHCADCHVAPADGKRYVAGESPPLTGGATFDIPPGVFHAANLTPDSATGIGARSDAQLVAMLRHGVRHDGRAAIPFMAYQDLSDEDLTALISFLRSQPAVHHEITPRRFTLVGKIVMAFIIKPQGPKTPPLARTPLAEGDGYGEYLANNVAECFGCHTARSLVDGHFTGPRYAGGTAFDVGGDPPMEVVTPNLTPDSATGRIAHWSEEQFVARIHAGRAISQSVMPWESFVRMTDADIRAIYRYLHQLPPVHNDPGPSLRQKK